MAVSNLSLATEADRDVVNQPVEPVALQRVTTKLFSRADHHTASFWLEANDVFNGVEVDDVDVDVGGDGAAEAQRRAAAGQRGQHGGGSGAEDEGKEEEEKRVDGE